MQKVISLRVFNYRRGNNLCNHVTQLKTIKKSNILITSYYIDIRFKVLLSGTLFENESSTVTIFSKEKKKKKKNTLRFRMNLHFIKFPVIES